MNLQGTIFKNNQLIFIDEKFLFDYKALKPIINVYKTSLDSSQSKILTNSLMIIAAVNTKGLIHHKIIQPPLRIPLYIEFLQELKMILDSESVALFYDGLSTHTSYKALQFIDECGWIGIKNVAYSYFDNPMQYVLGHINFTSHLKSQRDYAEIAGI